MDSKNDNRWTVIIGWAWFVVIASLLSGWMAGMYDRPAPASAASTDPIAALAYASTPAPPVAPKEREPIAAPKGASPLREGWYYAEAVAKDATYESVVAVVRLPSGAYRFRWIEGTVGLGTWKGDSVIVSFSLDKTPGTMFLTVNADGSLKGRWTTGGEWAEETWTYLRPLRKAKE